MISAGDLRRFWSDPDGTVCLVRRLFAEAFTRDRYGIFAIAVFCMIVVAITTAASAGLMRFVVNDIFVDQNAAKIWSLGAAVIAISVAKGFASYGQSVSLGRIGNAITASFQIRLINKITSLPVSYLSRTHSSKLILRIAKAATAPQSAILLVATSLVRDFLTVIALVIVMVYQDAVMAMIVLLIAPVVVLSVIRLVRRIRELDSDEFATTAAVVGATQETIRGMRVVKSFALEEEMCGRVADAARGAEKRGNAINAIQASTSPLMETLGGIAVAAVILYAGWQTTAMGKTPGEFMAFLTAFMMAYEPAKRLARLNVNLQRNLNRVRMIYGVLDEPLGDMENPGAIEIRNAVGRISVDGIDFGYQEGKPVLREVSLEANPGTVVALVGPSGAGKSTLFNLIQRLYAPWRGKISIDGIDIRDITNQSFREIVSVVNQDTFLFSGSIMENIGLGRPDASEDEIRAAADAALVTEFAKDLKEGLDAEVGENGMLLSGGQRQRIAIARAILKDAPVLLLDEATSSLDNESEHYVQQAIGELMKGRTTLVIAHRLSTIIAADHIYLMHRGQIVEEGTHEALLLRDARYAKLFAAGKETEQMKKNWELA